MVLAFVTSYEVFLIKETIFYQFELALLNVCVSSFGKHYQIRGFKGFLHSLVRRQEKQVKQIIIWEKGFGLLAPENFKWPSTSSGKVLLVCYLGLDLANSQWQLTSTSFLLVCLPTPRKRQEVLYIYIYIYLRFLPAFFLSFFFLSFSLSSVAFKIPFSSFSSLSFPNQPLCLLLFFL